MNIKYHIVSSFNPMGKPISQQSHRCSPFEVVYYIVMGYCLAFDATLARE
jgi:hypothetical protein